jgi:hypothetical protein
MDFAREPAVAAPLPRRRLVIAVAAGMAAAVALALGMAFVVPELGDAIRRRNEYGARRMMMKLHGAQSVLQASDYLDGDGDGVGRHGFFRELAVAPMLQPTEQFPAESHFTPALPRDFHRVVDGRVHARGYVYEIFLPALGGGWVSERDSAAAQKVDERLAAAFWVCYAWPEAWGTSGTWVYVATSGGSLLFSKNADARCDGERGPPPGAGFLAPHVGSAPAAMVADCLGDVWYSIG